MAGASSTARFLLQSLLQVVPEYTALEPYRDLNLNTWRKVGAYSPQSVTKSAFVLSVNNSREYAAALLADTQHLVNQVTEHRAHLLNALAVQSEPSPTWGFVTLYYMALYAAMAWTREANQAVVYLDKEAIAEYCGGVPNSPGGGAFLATQRTDAVTNQSSVSFTKYKSHFHEAVWIKTLEKADEAYKWISAQTAARSPTPDEFLDMRALDLFRGLPFSAGHAWPSKLRNALNYRPGYSYRSVLRNNTLRLNGKLTKPPFGSLEAVVTFGERAKRAIGKAQDPAGVPNEAIDLLLAYCLILEWYVEDALNALCDIQQLTCSAHVQRTRFRRAQCQTPPSALAALAAL